MHLIPCNDPTLSTIISSVIIHPHFTGEETEALTEPWVILPLMRDGARIRTWLFQVNTVTIGALLKAQWGTTGPQRSENLGAVG